MRRGLIIGWLLGALTVSMGLALADARYEYRVASTASEVQALVNRDGYQIVPDQAWTVYLRRPRIPFVH